MVGRISPTFLIPTAYVAAMVALGSCALVVADRAARLWLAVGLVAVAATVGAGAMRGIAATATAEVPPRRARIGWIVLLRLSMVVPPVLLLAQAATGRAGNGVVIAAILIVMGELLVTRMADVIERHQRALDRERCLRQACTTLLTVTDPGEVVGAVRAAVGRLIPPGTGFELVVEDLDLVPAPSADRRTRLIGTRLLHPALRAELGGFETTLVCPLGADRAATGSALLVAAPDRVLDGVRDAVEVLVAQAAMAIERIVLTDVLNRGDGDRYLRSVVRNTGDAVLVVGDDERIRYASPALMTVLGVHPAASATLRDIVHPTDHHQIARTRRDAQQRPDGPGASDRWNLRRSDGGRVTVEVNYRDLRRDRMVRGYVITIRDVTDHLNREREAIRRSLESSGGWRNRQSSLSRFR